MDKCNHAHIFRRVLRLPLVHGGCILVVSARAGNTIIISKIDLARGTDLSTLTVAELSAKIQSLLEGYSISEAAPATTPSVEVSVDDVKAVLAARAAVEAAEREKDRVEGAFKALLGDAEAATVGGEIVFTYKNGTARRLDQTALKEQAPEVYASFIKESPTRPLLAKSKIIARIFA